MSKVGSHCQSPIHINYDIILFVNTEIVKCITSLIIMALDFTDGD
jgi:hypothetical protein